MQQKIIEKKAQGAIEYLLLIGAVILVVAVVISYMAGVLDFGTDSGNRSLYDSMCGPRSSGGMDTNSLLCGCYLKTTTKGDYLQSGQYQPADKNLLICPKMLDPRYHNDTLLIWKQDSQ